MSQDKRDYMLNDKMQQSIVRLGILEQDKELLKRMVLKPGIWAVPYETRCEGRRCTRPITFGEVYWTDGMNNAGTRLCEVCGNCLKFTRKNALNRGERIDATVGGV